MNVRIEVFGFTVREFQPDGKGHAFDVWLDQPTSLHDLLATHLHVDPADKSVLINGRYMTPGYSLQDGDLVQILRMLEGG